MKFRLSLFLVYTRTANSIQRFLLLFYKNWNKQEYFKTFQIEALFFNYRYLTKTIPYFKETRKYRPDRKKKENCRVRVRFRVNLIFAGKLSAFQDSLETDEFKS